MKRSNLASYLLSLMTTAGAGCEARTHVAPDAASGCGTYIAAPSDAGCSALCADHGCPTGFCSLAPDTANQYILVCTQDHTGRRPPGLVRLASRARSLHGRYFANAAYLEAASVPAFRRVARELGRFGAPARLQHAAERSAREEVGHASAMRRFAAAHGAKVPRLVVRPMPRRSLEAFAQDNAVEGCVKETYGAAIAIHQGRHASDPVLRAAMTAIAADECRHAELAFQIDAWVTPRLTASARARVARARRHAAVQLHRRERAARDACWATDLGLPRVAHRRALTDELLDTIWRAG